MIKKQLLGFIARWILSTFGMWLSIRLFGETTGDENFLAFVIAGFIFSLANAFVRPLATLIALPLIVFTMGLFTILINVAIVSLTIWLTPNVEMDFVGAVFSSLIMSLVNGVVNFWVSPYTSK